MSCEIFILSDSQGGERLDKLLTTCYPEYSRTYFQELIEKGCVLVNGEILKKREKPKPGDEVEVLFALRPGIDLTPENIPLDILYEDEHLIAVNKPAGMVVHPAPGHPCHTFVNALLYHCDITHHDTLRPGIVHRLDKDTSGVLLAAKTERAHSALVALFASRTIQKTYLAIAYGKLADGLIEAPIGRHLTDRKKMAISSEKGKEAKTFCTTLATTEALSLLKLTLITGRTHQIRVHLAYKGAPVLGDLLYGNKGANERYKTQRQLLHAHEIQFEHPLLGIPLKIKAPVPSDFQIVPAFISYLN